MEQHEGLGNLFSKLAAISGELGAIPKSAKHQQGYSYQSADDVMAHLNPLLSAANIAIIPMATHTRLEVPTDGVSRYVIDYEFVICDGDSGATFVAAWQGEVPTGYAGGKIDDKAMGKAHTYALKYWLLKLFKVTSQDDVDQDRTVHTDPPRKTQSTQSTQVADKKPGNVTDMPTQQTDGDKEYFAASTTKIYTNTDKNNNRYHTISGASLRSREALRALGFDNVTIAELEFNGEHALPDAVSVVYTMNGKFKNIVRIRRDSTGEVVDKDGKAVSKAS